MHETCPLQETVTERVSLSSDNTELIRLRIIDGEENCPEECPLKGGLAINRPGLAGKIIQYFAGPKRICSFDIVE